MTGVEAAFSMREFEQAQRHNRVPIIAISGNVQASEQASYLRAGMDGFVAKPFKRDDFVQILTKYRPGTEQQQQPEQQPQQQNNDAGAISKPTPSPEINGSGLGSSHVRILLANGSISERNIYKRILAQYDADILKSGQEVLDNFSSNSYDVILLHNNLEDMPVQDVVQQIRHHEQLSNLHVPIILVCTTAEEEEALRDKGANQCLIKGHGFVNPDLLMQAVLRCVSGEVPPHIASQESDLFDDHGDLCDTVFLEQLRHTPSFVELMQLFLGYAESIVSNLEKYQRETDVTRMVIESHNCSSIASNIGAVWLSRVAFDLKKVVSDGWSDKVPQHVDRVIKALNMTLGDLKVMGIIKQTGPKTYAVIPPEVPNRAASKSPSASSESLVTTNNNKARVMIVDDVSMNRFVINTLLSQYHYHCDLVSSCEEALALLRDNPDSYDLILMVPSYPHLHSRLSSLMLLYPRRTFTWNK